MATERKIFAVIGASHPAELRAKIEAGSLSSTCSSAKGNG